MAAGAAGDDATGAGALQAVVKDTFKEADTNGDGFISRQELVSLLKALDDSLTVAELNILFDAADCNVDGKLIYAEFVDFLYTSDIGTVLMKAAEPRDDMAPTKSGHATFKATATGQPKKAQLAAPLARKGTAPSLRHCAITKWLGERQKLKNLIEEIYEQVKTNKKGLDMEGLSKLAKKVAAKMGIAEGTFGDLDGAFLCFDFNGNGWLSLNEAQRCMR